MFQVTDTEAAALRLHSATSKPMRGGRRYCPYAFTEHGAVMVSAVLTTRVAVQTSILIARAFVGIRQWMATQRDFAEKLTELGKRLIAHDVNIAEIFKILRRLMMPTKRGNPRIGYFA